MLLQQHAQLSSALVCSRLSLKQPPPGNLRHETGFDAIHLFVRRRLQHGHASCTLTDHVHVFASIPTSRPATMMTTSQHSRNSSFKQQSVNQLVGQRPPPRPLSKLQLQKPPSQPTSQPAPPDPSHAAGERPDPIRARGGQPQAASRGAGDDTQRAECEMENLKRKDSGMEM